MATNRPTMRQPTLGMGTPHVCRHDVRAIRQCGAVWECEQAECCAGEAAICPSCEPFPFAHSRYYGNRAKREPPIAAFLARLDARQAATRAHLADLPLAPEVP